MTSASQEEHKDAARTQPAQDERDKTEESDSAGDDFDDQVTDEFTEE